jgi:hypothetical protein
MQNVLGARGRPQSEEPMVEVRERPPAADGDETRVAVLGEDHGTNHICGRTCPNWRGATYARDVLKIERLIAIIHADNTSSQRWPKSSA